MVVRIEQFNMYVIQDFITNNRKLEFQVINNHMSINPSLV